MPASDGPKVAKPTWRGLYQPQYLGNHVGPRKVNDQEYKEYNQTMHSRLFGAKKADRSASRKASKERVEEATRRLLNPPPTHGSRAATAGAALSSKNWKKKTSQRGSGSNYVEPVRHITREKNLDGKEFMATLDKKPDFRRHFRTSRVSDTRMGRATVTADLSTMSRVDLGSAPKLEHIKAKFQAFCYGRGGSPMDMKNEFRHLDTDGNGNLSYKEFCVAVRKMARLSNDELKVIIQYIDKNDDRVIDYMEFVKFITSRVGVAKIHENEMAQLEDRHRQEEVAREEMDSVRDPWTLHEHNVSEFSKISDNSRLLGPRQGLSSPPQHTFRGIETKLDLARAKLKAAAYTSGQGADYRKELDRMDTNRDGIVSHKEFARGLRRVVPLPSDQLAEVIAAVDTDHDGQISIDEFLAFVGESGESAEPVLPIEPVGVLQSPPQHTTISLRVPSGSQGTERVLERAAATSAATGNGETPDRPVKRRSAPRSASLSKLAKLRARLQAACFAGSTPQSYRTTLSQQTQSEPGKLTHEAFALGVRSICPLSDVELEKIVAHLDNDESGVISIRAFLAFVHPGAAQSTAVEPAAGSFSPSSSTAFYNSLKTRNRNRSNNSPAARKKRVDSPRSPAVQKSPSKQAGGRSSTMPVAATIEAAPGNRYKRGAMHIGDRYLLCSVDVLTASVKISAFDPTTDESCIFEIPKAELEEWGASASAKGEQLLRAEAVQERILEELKPGGADGAGVAKAAEGGEEEVDNFASSISELDKARLEAQRAKEALRGAQAVIEALEREIAQTKGRLSDVIDVSKAIFVQGLKVRPSDPHVYFDEMIVKNL